MGDKIVMLSCLAGALVGWFGWYSAVLGPLGPRRRRHGVTAIALAPIMCGMMLYWVLRHWAPTGVARDIRHLALYLAVGALWLNVAVRLFPWLGVSVRDDVVERDNPAATPALVGAMLGVTCSFIGANIGAGSGWRTVVFLAGLATVTLAALWLSLELLCRMAESVTVERDTAAGWRLGGFLAGAGLVLGRGAAGDWTTTGRALVEFAYVGMLTIPLLIVAVVVEILLVRTADVRRRSTEAWGIAPAWLYVWMAYSAVAKVGAP